MFAAHDKTMIKRKIQAYLSNQCGGYLAMSNLLLLATIFVNITRFIKLHLATDVAIT
jgi:hypothetical protein